MYQSLRSYLPQEGRSYLKPEKAGPLEEEMRHLKKLGQAARIEFTAIVEMLAPKIAPLEKTRISHWASHAQVLRPHFWCYFKSPEDAADDVAMAVRMYGTAEQFGISVEVSFIERKKSDQTLRKQARVLDLPIANPLYYRVQEKDEMYCLEGTEANRQLLRQKLAAQEIRKVLVKWDLPVTDNLSWEELTNQLAAGFERLKPYYVQAKG